LENDGLNKKNFCFKRELPLKQPGMKKNLSI